MNRQHILFHLREALGELTRTIADIEGDPEYGEGEFRVAIEHLYHHINTAWNARVVSEARAKECTEEDFQNWRRFPADVDLEV